MAGAERVRCRAGAERVRCKVQGVAEEEPRLKGLLPG